MTCPPLAREMPDGSRIYVHPQTGEEAPSVTTVMKMIAAPELEQWKRTTNARYTCLHWDELGELPVMMRAEEISTAHEQVSRASRVKGDALHEMIEAWSKGEPFPDGKQLGSCADQFTGFLMHCKPKMIASEFTVWSREHRYAGTADFLAEIGGKTWLIDTKSGRRVYPEVGLQLAALANADFILDEDGTEREIPQVDYLAALHIRPRSWKLIPAGNNTGNFECFLAARRIWDWKKYTAPEVLQGAA